MEEKKVKIINLSTVFLILALIVIVVMGVYIYKLNTDKTIEIQKSTELQAQVNSLNGKVSELQGKIDSISATINSNNSNDNENNTTTDEIKLNIGTYSVKNITEEERNDNVISWIQISSDNKFSIARTWRNV